MKLNYFKVAIRNLLKHKVFSFINIFGLAIGLTCCILIGAFLYDELSYDRFPDQAGQIYRIGIHLNENGGMADYPYVDVAVGAGIKNAYPEVLASTRISPLGEVLVKNGDKPVKENHFAFCDSNFLQFFSIPLVEGDPKTALVAPDNIVVSREIANRYFGNAPALGKTLKLFGGCKVSGVFDKIPDNSHFHYDAFLSMASNRYFLYGNTWSNIGNYTYLKLDPKADPKQLEAKFPDLVEKYIVAETAHDMGVSMAEAHRSAQNWHFYLMPLTDIHLHSNSKYEMEPNGDIQYVYIFGALAIFILLLACVNFTNLATASSSKRSREVGIRKVLGSEKKQLIVQFLGEAILMSFFAMVLALIFADLLLPLFNLLSAKHIQFQTFMNPKAIASLFGLALVTGILAGIYPSLFLSSFKITSVLKGASGSRPGSRSLLRNGLVVFQFMVSTALIVATLVVYKQLHFMQNKKLGFDKDQVLVVQDTYALHKDQYAFKQQLLKDSRVLNATISQDAPIDRAGTQVDGSEIYAKLNKHSQNAGYIHSFYFHVDYDYLSTLGMKMAAGRYFSKEMPSDSSAVVINESAVGDLGWRNNQDALNQTIISSGLKEYRVIGVVRNFHYTSAKQKIAPLMIMLGNNSGSLMLKINTKDIRGFISDLKQKWAAYNIETPFSYYFLDDRFASLYTAEEKTGQLFTLFAVVAIIIACLGLFGLVTFNTQQRTKEIGIRKVLGSSTYQAMILVSKDFIWLVGIAFLISIPITWLAMQAWLNNFAYRISLSVQVFLLAGLLTLLIALITVSLQAIKAALANPADSLRTE
jgi:putative ABC transport system permease protein